MASPDYFLGLNGVVSQNPAAALVKNGKLVAFAEEERFNRIKQAPYMFPALAAEYCLKTAGVGWEDVKVSLGWFIPDTARKKLALAARFPSPWVIQKVNRLKFIAPAHKEFRALLPRMETHYHHMSHAASAYYVSGFNRANTIVADGAGEVEATSLYDCVGREMRSFPVRHKSLGVYYARFTAFLGFNAHCDEGKVMGLASYGRPAHDPKEFIRLYPDGYSLAGFGMDWGRALHAVKKFLASLGYLEYSESAIHRMLTERFGAVRKADGPIEKKHQDLAFLIQSIYEMALLHLARISAERTGKKDLCLAGGCALNCTGNGRLSLEAGAGKMFVQPAAHDGGAALGAALLSSDEIDRGKFVMEHAYWGPEYPAEEIAGALDAAGLAYSREGDIAGTAA